MKVRQDQGSVNELEGKEEIRHAWRSEGMGDGKGETRDKVVR